MITAEARRHTINAELLLDFAHQLRQTALILSPDGGREVLSERARACSTPSTGCTSSSTTTPEPTTKGGEQHDERLRRGLLQALPQRPRQVGVLKVRQLNHHQEGDGPEGGRPVHPRTLPRPTGVD